MSKDVTTKAKCIDDKRRGNFVVQKLSYPSHRPSTSITLKNSVWFLLYLNILVLESSIPFLISNNPPWDGYGYFLEQSTIHLEKTSVSVSIWFLLHTYILANAYF